MSWHIVIAGGGFGGFHAARTLERVLAPQAARVTLVTDSNFMLYTPLLPGAAAGTLEPRHVVVPLREELRRTDLWLGTVVGNDPATSTLKVRVPEDDAVEDLRYDQLIVALGSVSRTLPVPGLAEHAVGFKSLPEAIALRNRLIRTLEIAERMTDAAERAAWLTYVFVGAGYAGLEGLAELQDFAADVIELYPRCRTSGVRFMLVEAQERVMPEIPAPLAEFSMRELRSRGIDIRTNTTLDAVTASTATLSGGEVVPTRTVVWTAGVRPQPVIADMGLPVDRGGRLEVDRTMLVHGTSNIWAIGDAAAVPDPARGLKHPTPPTAQHAIRQGRLVARNVAATLGTGKVKPFRFKTKGVFVDMGRSQAVASTMGIRWRGAPAWWLARSYHLAMMPGTKRKLRLLIDWNVGLVFGRDTSELGQLGHPPALTRVDTNRGAPSTGPVEAVEGPHAAIPDDATGTGAIVTPG
ncbi:MAG: NAD(P)/FAD-dependent oxidoreductase [Solirubrobacterales bacterium]|nr:NAD(P)/FAD-dependent oxidoreductase [Solirubrobacterales bacterium]